MNISRLLRMILTIYLSVYCAAGWTQENTYQIDGQLENYLEDSIFLGYYFADKQYLLDTAKVENGRFTFSGEDTLVPGAYLVVIPPDNRFFQVMINDPMPHFSLKGDLQNLETSLTFNGSEDNTLFYENLKFISAKRSEMEAINQRKAQVTTPEEQVAVDTAIQNLNRDVISYQEKLVEDHPNTLTAKLVESGFQIAVPTFEGTDEEVRTKQYLHYKKHYFDHVDLTDSRLLRSPQHVLYDKVNYYLEKLTPQHPDSIIQSLDYLLKKMEESEEIYKYYLVKFLNDYANNKIVGMDAVYVHLALEYYAKGKAPWVEEEQLEKIIANASDAEPTLIGKMAPDFTVQDRDSVDISLYDIDSPYTVLIFWAHDCGHCQKTMPDLLEFYSDYHDKGVEIFAVCTKLNADEPPCWDFIDENSLGVWINGSDKRGGRSFIHSRYNIKKTPKVFVLDENKKILSKELGPEQLHQFFDQQFGIDTQSTGN